MVRRRRAGAAKPPVEEADVIVCVCRNVTDRAIREGALAGKPLETVLRETGAGSGCGSCILAVVRIHAAARAAAAPQAPGADAGSVKAA